VIGWIGALKFATRGLSDRAARRQQTLHGLVLPVLRCTSSPRFRVIEWTAAVLWRFKPIAKEGVGGAMVGSLIAVMHAFVINASFLFTTTGVRSRKAEGFPALSADLWRFSSKTSASGYSLWNWWRARCRITVATSEQDDRLAFDEQITVDECWVREIVRPAASAATRSGGIGAPAR